MRRLLKVDVAGDVRRLPVEVAADCAQAAHCGNGQARAEALRGAFSEIQSAVRAGYGCFPEDEELVLKYPDEEEDLCTLTEATVEDFLFRGPGSCASELTALKLVAAPGKRTTVPRPEEPEEEGSRAMATVVPEQQTAAAPEFYAPREDRKAPRAPRSATEPSALRSMGPLALLACMKSLHSCGRLSAAVVASLALQFLPILAQRVQRKQEKINRKGSKMRQQKPLLQLLQRVCEQIRSIPEAEDVRPALKAYVCGSGTARLGNILADLLRKLVSCKSRTAVAAAVLGVAEEMLAVLPCLFPETFGGKMGTAPTPASFPGPCGAMAAAIAGAPVHEGFACSRCGALPIVGPRFEVVDKADDNRKWASETQSLCGECFARDSVHCPCNTRNFACRLAPEGYNAEAMLDDSAANSAAETWALTQLAPPWVPQGCWFAPPPPPGIELPAPLPAASSVAQERWHHAYQAITAARQMPLPMPLTQPQQEFDLTLAQSLFQ